MIDKDVVRQFKSVKCPDCKSDFDRLTPWETGYDNQFKNKYCEFKCSECNHRFIVVLQKPIK